MLKTLKGYYQDNGISAIDFHCPFHSDCSRYSSDRFTTAKEAFISTGYEKHELPRILFLSLDSGSASNDPTEKTIESIRRQEENECNVLSLPRNKHWFRTHELAYTLLRNLAPELKLEEAKHFFAHTNSAKCCQNNASRGQAAETLFSNCRRYIPGEIMIFAPDVLITQGDYAKKAVENAFEYLDMKGFSSMPFLPEEVKLLSFNTKPTLWIHTFHPRNPNSKKNRDNYTIYEKVFVEFLKHEPLIQPQVLRIERTAMKTQLPRTKFTPSVTTDLKDVNYIFLNSEPVVPLDGIGSPTLSQCKNFEFITMVQLCNIAENNNMTRSFACNAFGGDKGKRKVEPARMARAVMVGNKLRKYVLVSAAAQFFAENRVRW